MHGCKYDIQINYCFCRNKMGKVIFFSRNRYYDTIFKIMRLFLIIHTRFDNLDLRYTILLLG